MSDSPKRLLSIVVPVLNEEHNVLPLYQAVTPILDGLSARYDYELIFTDNHSMDRTFEVLAELAARDRRVRVYRFSRNFGFQRSIYTGYHQARGDAVIQIDCDLQDPPELIVEFVRKWEEGYHVVYGIRRTRKEGWLIGKARGLFYYLINVLSEHSIPRQAGDFRLVARPLIEELKKMDEAYPYLRGMIATLGFNQIGIPYGRHERKRGHSKFGFKSLLALAIDGILNTSIIPLRVATYTGLVVSLLTFLAIIFYIVAALAYGRGQWPSGFATITIFVLLSVGMNTLFLGIIGEYLGRVYHHVKKRPLTIIEHSIDAGTYTNHAAPPRGREAPPA